MGIPEEEKEKGMESICKAIMTESLPKLGREKYIKIHESQRNPSSLKPNVAIQTHYNYIEKVTDKERIFKAQEKEGSYIQENHHKKSVDFSIETFHSRRQWDDIFNILKEKKCQ